MKMDDFLILTSIINNVQRQKIFVYLECTYFS